MFSRKFLTGAALTALSFAASSGAAQAQSTASQIQEDEIVVTAVRRSIDGAISAEQAAKARSTITQDFIDQQLAGQSILSTINLIPGVSFTNNDPYGSSGGNIRMRGFDGARISLTFDGVPLNDTGNYAIFSNQMLDPELISRANVNMGTTDVDSPTASATGGTINYVTRMPSEDFGVMVQPSFGSDNYYRLLTVVDTGTFGPANTTAFGAVSYQHYDQFIGSGDLEKLQLNARVYQPLQGDDFMSLAVHWNRNRNYFYRQGSLAEWAFYDEVTNLDVCTRDAPTAGVADNEGSSAAGAGAFLSANDNPANPASCTNYAGLRINPANTGNIRGQSRFALGENLTLTFDPTAQYVLANGGGTTVVSETDSRLRAGTLLTDSVNAACVVFDAPTSGLDLNGDCDTRDSIRLYSPSNTNTIRYAVLSSLIWELNDSHRFVFGYTYDTGRHRQTGEYSLLDPSGDPGDVFGAKDEEGGAPILTLAGTVFQKRDRLSTATLSQFSVRYVGDFLQDALTIDLGVRAPEFERNLDQRCYTVAASTGDPTCATGFVPAGVAPFRASVSYEDVLPSLGVVYRPGQGQQLFFSYAEGLSAPRTDDLYNGLTVAQLDNVQPETSQAYDLGYRYQGGGMILSTTAWFNAFQNRIVRVFDPLEGINIARNIGDVDLWGAELELGFQASDDISLYFSAAYTDSEVQENLPITGATFALTAGKQLVETPDWTFGGRVEWENGPFQIGLQGKFVGDRWTTDVNDQLTNAYTTFDLDARWDFGQTLRNERTYLQLNILNLLDEEYFGSFGSQVATTGPGAGTVRYNIGAPRTVQLSLRAEF